jgi:type IV pilus assembly protein PilA
MKLKKRFKGFTMIELIIVMAILAVLCGVLVPNGIAWIRDSKIKTCNSEAKTIFNTAVTVLQDYQLEGKVSKIVSNDGANNTATIVSVAGKDTAYFGKYSTSATKDNEAVQKITSKLGSNFSDNSAWSVRVEVSNISDRNTNTIKVLSTIFGDTENSMYVGRYPRPANIKSEKSFSDIVGSVNTYCNTPSDSDSAPSGEFDSQDDPLTKYNS